VGCTSSSDQACRVYDIADRKPDTDLRRPERGEIDFIAAPFFRQNGGTRRADRFTPFDKDRQ
jgi:hypothetical protein